jgi:predicted O-methyltransferase YrrM
MVHKTSVEAEQRRFARKTLQRNAFQDRIACETVNLLTRQELSNVLAASFDFVLPSATEVDRGEVLSDSRGRGTLQ